MVNEPQRLPRIDPSFRIEDRRRKWEQPVYDPLVVVLAKLIKLIIEEENKGASDSAA